LGHRVTPSVDRRHSRIASASARAQRFERLRRAAAIPASATIPNGTASSASVIPGTVLQPLLFCVALLLLTCFVAHAPLLQKPLVQSWSVVHVVLQTLPSAHA
jgi:hypothetical protein